MSKVILLDWGIFSHRAIFSTLNNPKIPATYTAVSMILGNLKRIGVTKDDLIIIAVDSRNSWRKDFEKEYKGDRKAKRDESSIDWDRQYQLFDELLEALEISTNWARIKVPRTEADDIMAVACRYFTDKEIILATYDSDLEQCWAYDNVKIFSPQSKKWKVPSKNFNAYTLIAKKIQKEVSDNLVSPILNEKDYFNRKTCVDLLTLPEWVEKEITTQLQQIENRTFFPESFPFKTLRERYLTLYSDKSKIIVYEVQVEKAEQKEARKKRKKMEEKLKAKRKKEREAKKLTKVKT